MARSSPTTWSRSTSGCASCWAVPTMTIGRTPNNSSAMTRWAIPWTRAIPGTKPRKRDVENNYTWVMSPRWFDERTGDYLALDTGGGPLPRLWATALNGLVDIGYIKATGNSVVINLPKTATLPEVAFEWKIPKW